MSLSRAFRPAALLLGPLSNPLDELAIAVGERRLAHDLTDQELIEAGTGKLHEQEDEKLANTLKDRQQTADISQEIQEVVDAAVVLDQIERVAE